MGHISRVLEDNLKDPILISKWFNSPFKPFISCAICIHNTLILFFQTIELQVIFFTKRVMQYLLISYLSIMNSCWWHSNITVLDLNYKVHLQLLKNKNPPKIKWILVETYSRDGRIASQWAIIACLSLYDQFHNKHTCMHFHRFFIGYYLSVEDI